MDAECFVTDGFCERHHRVNADSSAILKCTHHTNARTHVHTNIRICTDIKIALSSTHIRNFFCVIFINVIVNGVLKKKSLILFAFRIAKDEPRERLRARESEAE